MLLSLAPLCDRICEGRAWPKLDAPFVQGTLEVVQSTWFSR
jgi:hypothetical protein